MAFFSFCHEGKNTNSEITKFLLVKPNLSAASSITILAVDDNPTILRDIEERLSPYCKKVVGLSSGFQALEFCKKNRPDLILLDIEMPQMDGFAVLSSLQRGFETKSIPVIFLTTRNDPATEARAIDNGAVDFLQKPFNTTVLLHRAELHLKLARYQRHLEHTLKQVEDSIIYSFIELLESRDEHTGGHARRTSLYLALLGEELLKTEAFGSDITRENIDLMSRAALLHDRGKVNIRDSVLLKPGKLLEDEFNVMKRHPQVGADVLRKIQKRTPEEVYLDYAITLAEGHHEKWNGTGYPYRLGGEKIPLPARIMAVADVYDACASNRVYRPALDLDLVRDIIINGFGTHFDPRLQEAFERAEPLMHSVAASHLLRANQIIVA
jgi:putative two-component system response regulator